MGGLLLWITSCRSFSLNYLPHLAWKSSRKISNHLLEDFLRKKSEGQVILYESWQTWRKDLYKGVDGNGRWLYMLLHQMRLGLPLSEWGSSFPCCLILKAPRKPTTRSTSFLFLKPLLSGRKDCLLSAPSTLWCPGQTRASSRMLSDTSPPEPSTGGGSCTACHAPF